MATSSCGGGCRIRREASRKEARLQVLRIEVADAQAQDAQLACAIVTTNDHAEELETEQAQIEQQCAFTMSKQPCVRAAHRSRHVLRSSVGRMCTDKSNPCFHAVTVIFHGTDCPVTLYTARTRTACSHLEACRLEELTRKLDSVCEARDTCARKQRALDRDKAASDGALAELLGTVPALEADVDKLRLLAAGVAELRGTPAL
jgi:hypothetical protein